MKKFLLVFVILSLFTISAHAKVGDIKETIYNSDILTKVHNREIDSFCIDGVTLIKAEDLRNYGYTVTYDDTIRSLFIKKTGVIEDDFYPEFERGTVGGIYGYAYETDINVFYNGQYINSYALDGVMAVKVEDLGTLHGLTYTYDDGQRLLSLDDASVPSKEAQIESELTVKEEYAGIMSKNLIERYSGSGFDVIYYRTGGLPRPAVTYNYYDDKGVFVTLDGIFNTYGFHDGWGRTLVSETELCGNALVFKGKSMEYRTDRNFPEGEYVLDLCTHIITPSPVGAVAKPVGFNITVDGVAVQGYDLCGRTFIDSAVLKNGIEEIASYGVIERAEEPVTINGKTYETYLMDGKLLVNADDVAIEERNIIPNGFVGGWDNSSSTLKIETDVSIK